ncbi:HK97 family phage prohead protease [Bradyrhizobium sp. AZCC 1578]|uniref:HK97 family phage prohead protease n=1 Tax=Bradyrhizobium sp. AZCC 1578 TaxID=3117027 RepID=UPI002FF2763B
MTKEIGAFFELDTKSITADGVFTGYASKFDEQDLGRDIVKPGAFAKALASKPLPKIKMLRNHDTSEPIGVWTSLIEDERGLKATGQLILDTTRGRETYSLLKAGALDGLSIGYRATKDTFDRIKNVRLLQEVDLFEISVVTFPMLPSATVSRVKSSTEFQRLIQAINAANAAIH